MICMEDLILILVLSGIGLVTLLVSVWLFYRKKRKTTEKKRACTAECRAAIVDVGNYHARNKHRMLKAAGGVSAAHFLSGAGGTGRRAASLGVKMAQARKKVGTELTLFIEPAKPTSFYCLEEEKGYFQQRLAYLIVALLVIAVLIMIGVMWLTI